MLCCRRRYAWGDDEVGVLKRQPLRWFDLGLTIVDSLDTLLMMGLEEEYHEVSSALVFDHR